MLAELNHQLIRDEGHRNKMTVPQLQERMKVWITSEYRAVIFEDGNKIVAYALFREQTDDIYLRQLFVKREHRSLGIGRKAVELLRNQIWTKGKRLTVEVLVSNQRAVNFWRTVGYRDYCLAMEILPE